MKRCFFTVIAIVVLASMFGVSLHAQQVGQPKTYANAKPMTFGYNMKTYYLVQKTNLNAILAAVPEDKFYALPPGCSAESCRGEQSSIGAEVAHMADAQWRMCTIMATGVNPPAASLPGTVVLKMTPPTKQAMLDASAKSFDCMDALVNNFDDSKITAMVNSQHAMQPFASTLFNVISHDREVYGRVLSFMASMGIKAPGEINASDPANKEDMYFCGGTSAKTMDNCK